MTRISLRPRPRTTKNLDHEKIWAYVQQTVQNTLQGTPFQASLTIRYANEMMGGVQVGVWIHLQTDLKGDALDNFVCTKFEMPPWGTLTRQSYNLTPTGVDFTASIVVDREHC